MHQIINIFIEHPETQTEYEFWVEINTYEDIITSPSDYSINEWGEANGINYSSNKPDWVTSEMIDNAILEGDFDFSDEGDDFDENMDWDSIDYEFD